MVYDIRLNNPVIFFYESNLYGFIYAYQLLNPLGTLINCSLRWKNKCCAKFNFIDILPKSHFAFDVIAGRPILNNPLAPERRKMEQMKCCMRKNIYFSEVLLCRLT